MEIKCHKFSAQMEVSGQHHKPAPKFQEKE